MQENISRQFKEMQKTIDDMNKKLNIKKEIIIKEPNRNFAAEIFKHEIKKKKKLRASLQQQNRSSGRKNLQSGGQDFEISTHKNKEKRIEKYEESPDNIWDAIKQNNIHIIQIPEGKEKERGIENLLNEIIFENIPGLEGKIQV